ncbi:hypothetical protein RB653_002555 [Dictyostelium firmibasis]|uniref:Uncharacterized protein n=1 Tax=Dictyostelium firmibasis TaxID=79012 RepID=A0AAN7YVQ6_9MYCE
MIDVKGKDDKVSLPFHFFQTKSLTNINPIVLRTNFKIKVIVAPPLFGCQFRTI